MQDPLSKADRYRKRAVECHELATASPAYLGDFYRRVAVRYLFMAEEGLKLSKKQGNLISKQNGLSPNEPADADDTTKAERPVKERDITLEESLAAILENAVLLKRNSAKPEVSN
jgi:hypothetical protein